MLNDSIGIKCGQVKTNGVMLQRCTPHSLHANCLFSKYLLPISCQHVLDQGHNHRHYARLGVCNRTPCRQSRIMSGCLSYLEVDFVVVGIQESLTGSKERWYDCQFPAARLARAVNALPSGLSFHQDCQLRACTYYPGMDLLRHKIQCISSATLPIYAKSKTHSQDPQASFSRTDHSRGTAYFLSNARSAVWQISCTQGA